MPWLETGLDTRGLGVSHGAVITWAPGLSQIHSLPREKLTLSSSGTLKEITH